MLPECECWGHAGSQATRACNSAPYQQGAPGTPCALNWDRVDWFYRLGQGCQLSKWLCSPPYTPSRLCHDSGVSTPTHSLTHSSGSHSATYTLRRNVTRPVITPPTRSDTPGYHQEVLNLKKKKCISKRMFPPRFPPSNFMFNLTPKQKPWRRQTKPAWSTESLEEVSSEFDFGSVRQETPLFRVPEKTECCPEVPSFASSSKKIAVKWDFIMARSPPHPPTAIKKKKLRSMGCRGKARTMTEKKEEGGGVAAAFNCRL